MQESQLERPDPDYGSLQHLGFRGRSQIPGAFGFSAYVTAVSFQIEAVSAIPEPSTYAAFAGLGALGLVIWRRRQVMSAA